MSTKADVLLRQQYLVPQRNVKKLKEMSRQQGLSAGELARRAIEAYTAGPSSGGRSDDETAARALLADIHQKVRATLERIDASLAEARAQELESSGAAFRDRVRRETLAWIGDNRAQADAIAELLAPATARP